MPQPIKVRADVEITCFAYDGVEKIKDSMRVAQACGSEACPVSMKLVAAPRYVLTTSTLDKAQVQGEAAGKLGRGSVGGQTVQLGAMAAATACRMDERSSCCWRCPNIARPTTCLPANPACSAPPPALPPPPPACCRALRC